MGALAGILGLLTQAPKIISLAAMSVQAVETLLGKGNGAQKKSAAVAMTSSALEGLATVKLAGGSPLATPTFVAALEELIDAIVKLMNALPAEVGGFTHAAGK